MSPTYHAQPRFVRDYARLSTQQQRQFLDAVAEMVADMKAGRPFRPGLRVKRVQSVRGLWEMTWAPDGRATWQYGPERAPSDPHVIWRRIGTHDVFRDA